MKEWTLNKTHGKSESQLLHASRSARERPFHYKMHFGSRYLLLSDYCSLCFIRARNPNLQVVTTHTQHLCRQLRLDFH